MSDFFKPPIDFIKKRNNTSAKIALLPFVAILELGMIGISPAYLLIASTAAAVEIAEKDHEEGKGWCLSRSNSPK